MNENPNYTLLGNFDLKGAKDICDMLESRNIVFRIEADDSAIRGMVPMQAVLGGTFGAGATANIYVDPDSLEQCKKMLSEIF